MANDPLARYSYRDVAKQFDEIMIRTLEEAFDDVKLYDDSDFDTYDKSSNDITVVSPGIMPSNHMVKNSNNIISDIETTS